VDEALLRPSIVLGCSIKGSAVALAARKTIESLLMRIERFDVPRPYAAEWYEMYLHALYIERHTSPAAFRTGSWLLRAALHRVAQFVGENRDLVS